MPFGVTSAGNSFVRTVTQTLEPTREVTGSFVDEMAVLSKTRDDYLSDFDAYLQRIKESGLTLGLHLCPTRNQICWPYPRAWDNKTRSSKSGNHTNIQPAVPTKNTRKLMGFFSYFSAFIPSLAETASVITDLTQKDQHNKGICGRIHVSSLSSLVRRNHAPD